MDVKHFEVVDRNGNVIATLDLLGPHIALATDGVRLSGDTGALILKAECASFYTIRHPLPIRGEPANENAGPAAPRSCGEECSCAEPAAPVLAETTRPPADRETRCFASSDLREIANELLVDFHANEVATTAADREAQCVATNRRAVETFSHEVIG